MPTPCLPSVPSDHLGRCLCNDRYGRRDPVLRIGVDCVRDRISTHVCNDDRRLYEFVRDSKIPHGTFDTGYRLTANRALWIATTIVAIVLGAML